MRTEGISVAPGVGGVLPYLCLVSCWHRVRCDVCVVSWFKLIGPRCIIVCAGGLAFLTRVSLRWFPAVVIDCLCMSTHRVSL